MTVLRGVIVSVSLFLLAACQTAPGPVGQSSADYPVYSSIESLNGMATAIVVVEIGQVASQEMDNGGDETDEGVPMIFYEAEVLETWSGRVDGSTIVIGWPDLEKQPTEGRSSLNPGEKVLLFASRLTPVDAPGIDTQKVFYIPLAGDNGVLDLIDGYVVARSSNLTALSDDAVVVGASRLSIPIERVRAFVEAGSS